MLEVINRRLSDIEHISNLEDNGIFQSEQQRKPIKYYNSLRELEYQLNQHSYFRSPRKRRERENWKFIIDNTDENFPNLKKKQHIQVQETQRDSNKVN